MGHSTSELDWRLSVPVRREASLPSPMSRRIVLSSHAEDVYRPDGLLRVSSSIRLRPKLPVPRRNVELDPGPLRVLDVLFPISPDKLILYKSITRHGPVIPRSKKIE